jgi:hypothetical protein
MPELARALIFHSSLNPEEPTADYENDINSAALRRSTRCILSYLPFADTHDGTIMYPCLSLLSSNWGGMLCLLSGTTRATFSLFSTS